MTATTATPLLWASGAGRKRWARRYGWTLAVFALLAVMLLYEKIIHPSLGAFDMQSLELVAVPLAFAAMAQATVVIAGGIDLSIGPLMSLVNVIAASWMLHADLKGALLISLVLIVGTALAGAATGAAIDLTGVPDIIVTLATSFIWGGVALAVMPIPGGGAPIAWSNISTSLLWNEIPSGVVLILAVLLLVWLPLSRSRVGLAIFALGSNRNAAFLSGINVSLTRIVAYAIDGVFTALAGLAMTASNYGTGNPHNGDTYTLTSVAAVVLGGVSLTGGRGGMWGPVAAAFVLSLFPAILTFLGADPNYTSVIQGLIVIVVVMAAGLLLVRRRL